MDRILGGAAVAAAVIGVLVLSANQPAEALPMYAQRSGRSCANCHVSPTLEDPEGRGADWRLVGARPAL